MANNSLLSALYAGYQAFRRSYANPGSNNSYSGGGGQRLNADLLWAYYTGEMFDRSSPMVAQFASYRSANRLYRQIRSIYTYPKRIVEFYVSAIYPGVLSEDASKLPEGIPLAIPFTEDTPKRLKEAIGQIWQWSNMQAKKSVIVRYAAALGSSLIEVVDDVERGKIYFNVPYPGYVKDIRLDQQGNVKAYCLEYMTTNQQGGKDIYRKEVDRNAVREYRNNELFNQTDLSYGFCPAVWIKHTDMGDDYGYPAFSAFSALDELNGSMSLISDQSRKVVAAPVIFWTKDSPAKAFGDVAKRGATDELVNPDADRESLLYLKGSEGGRVDSLAGTLNISDAMKVCEALITELDAAFPEVTFWSQMREMSTLSGVAASRITGDVVTKVMEVAASYDNPLIAAHQMAVAIGGARLKAAQGAWANPTIQQQKFRGYDLESYERGNLDMAIAPRPLLPVSKKERAEEQSSFWQAAKTSGEAGYPLEQFLKDNDATDEQIAAVVNEPEPPAPVLPPVAPPFLPQDTQVNEGQV